MVAVTEIIWIVLFGLILSPLNPLMWGLYFVLAAILGVVATLGGGVLAVLVVILAVLAVLVLAILSVVPLLLIVVLAILVVTAPLYGIFILGDIIFTILFVLTPSWLFIAASFLFWISPPGIATAVVWLIVVFYVSYSYNGWNDTKDE